MKRSMSVHKSGSLSTIEVNRRTVGTVHCLGVPLKRGSTVDELSSIGFIT